MVEKYGQLYVVATPIGNLADISFRALETLKSTDLIAAEDTRHVRVLLQHYGINAKVIAFHQHNEEKLSETLLSKLRGGMDIALVSDAGTPLICDPGLPLINAAKEAGITVIPIPGACALVTALSAAGLPLSKFSFEGFPPRTSSARQAFFKQKLPDVHTWVFYESSHRILPALKDLLAVLPPGRDIVLARELTKFHETMIKTTIEAAVQLVQEDANMRKGEFVVIVAGAAEIKENEKNLSAEQKRILTLLLKHHSTKLAAELAAEITGARKKLLYQAALENSAIPEKEQIDISI